jgi:hypothetical protein
VAEDDGDLYGVRVWRVWALTADDHSLVPVGVEESVRVVRAADEETAKAEALRLSREQDSLSPSWMTADGDSASVTTVMADHAYFMGERQLELGHEVFSLLYEYNDPGPAQAEVQDEVLAEWRRAQ